MDGWKSFKQFARQRLKSGQRRVIPVVGSGFNLQASRKSSDWVALLIEIGRTLGLSESDMEVTQLKRVSTTAVWEDFISKVATRKNQAASAVESALKRVVQTSLTTFEAQHKTLPFYKAFLDLGFRDIVSLNFDRTLSLQEKGKVVSSSLKRDDPRLSQFANYARYVVTLFRRTELANVHKTRVWYPHGDTKNRDTIKLGIREYGIYIKSLEQAANLCLEEEISFLISHQYNYYYDPSIFNMHDYQYYRGLWSEEIRSHPELNWVWLLLNTPVVFLGCGLSWDEWPLWWLLHQRARNIARLPIEEREPVFVFWNVESEENKPMTEWLLRRPVDAVLLPCGNWSDGWNKIMEVLSS
jgi:hypothetical protein